MKKIIKCTVMFALSVVVLASCSKDNDPTDDNLFVGTYNGAINYSNSEDDTNISTSDGRVTLVKVGDSYNFDFSDGIPSLTGIKIEENQNIFVGADGAIQIDEGNLTIAYSQGTEVWGADCTR